MNPYIEGFLLLVCAILAIWGIGIWIMGSHMERKDKKEDEFARTYWEKLREDKRVE